MPPKKTCAAGPRPVRRSARQAAALAASPKTPEQSAADQKSSSFGLDAGDSSVERSPCSLIPGSWDGVGAKVEEAGHPGEKSVPDFNGGDEVAVVEGSEGGSGGVKEGGSVVESVEEGEKGVGNIVKRKRIVKRIVKVIKVVKKRVPKKDVVDGQGEDFYGANNKDTCESSMDVRVAEKGDHSVAMEVDGDHRRNVVNEEENNALGANTASCCVMPVRVENLVRGKLYEEDAKESAEDVDSRVQVNEGINGDNAVASVGLTVGFETSVRTEDHEVDMKESAENEDCNRVDGKKIKLSHVIAEEGVNVNLDAAASDGVDDNHEVVSSADTKVEVDGDYVGSSTGSKVEADGGFLWRGEMEALERRKRRKTEIFIGGLDKDATEDDLRRVFEEVGEIVDVRVVKHNKTGKSKGYAFVRYAVAADAKKALEKYQKVKIRGKECGTAPVEGNDTIFLGNINKQWKELDVINLLHGIGVDKIDKVTVLAHPNIPDRNRGFAFVELESSRDANIAYKKLQTQDELGKLGEIKVAWAEPLTEPDEEEMQKVKSVYAEFIPLSWEEERVREYFKKYGEIENVILARNLRSSRRKDFAFINFKDREAALTCIQSFKNELGENGSEVNIKVSLAKPIPKNSSKKKSSGLVIKPAVSEAPKSSQWVKANELKKKKGFSAGATNYLDRPGDSIPSRTAEAVQFLREREQASWMLPQSRLASGSSNLDRPYTLSGNKRPFPMLETDPLYSEFRGYGHARIEDTFQVVGERLGSLSHSHGSRMTSLPQNHRQSSARPFVHHYVDPGSSFQGDEAPYLGSAPPHYRYQYF